jgi:hypothetical protein
MESATSHTSNGGHGGGGHALVCCSDCSQEWDKLGVAKKRLALQRERMTLDQELIRAEKKNLKVNSKLMARNHSLEQVESLQEQVAKYQQDLHQQKEAFQQELQIIQQTATATATAAPSESVEVEVLVKQEDSIPKAQYEQELQDIQAQLSATQRSLAALFVERDTIERERNTLQQQKQQWMVDHEESNKNDASSNCPNCEDFQLQAEDLEESLIKLKKVYESAKFMHIQEKRQWELNKKHANEAEMQLLQKRMLQLGQKCKEFQTETKQLREEKAAAAAAAAERPPEVQPEPEVVVEEPSTSNLNNESASAAASASADASDDTTTTAAAATIVLQQENNRLQKELSEQTRQVEDMKLLIPRNKKVARVLLEQAESQNDELEAKVKTLQETCDDQAALVTEIQATTFSLLKQQEGERSEYQQVQMERDTLRKDLTEATLRLDSLQQELQDLKAELKHQKEQVFQLQNSTTTTTTNNNNNNNHVAPSSTPATGTPLLLSPQTVVIPSDLSTNTKTDKKHVIEWQWTTTTTTAGISGIYTGWLDSSGSPDGHGTLRIDDGSIYDGEWRRGLRHGAFHLFLLVCVCAIYGTMIVFLSQR